MAKSININIVYDSKRVGCESQCGLDWTSPEITSMVKQRVKERFGEIVKLELVDLSVINQFAVTLKNRIEVENLSLPVLLINDKVRIPGEFDMRQLLDAIEVECEINGTAI